MARIEQESRNRLSDNQFGMPEERKFPMHDIENASISLKEVERFGTPEEQRQVRSRVFLHFPSLRNV